MTEITTRDLIRLLEQLESSEETAEEWMEKNGLSSDVINEIIIGSVTGFMIKLALGEPLEVAAGTVMLSIFELGYEVRREFGQPPTEVDVQL